MKPPRVALLCALALLVATSADAQGVLDGMTETYRQASHGWIDRLMPLARHYFPMLAGIEMATFALLLMFRPSEHAEDAGALVLKLAFLAFCWALIFAYELWIPPIFDGFIVAGRVGAGGMVSSSGVLDIGDRIYAEIANGFGAGPLLNPVSVAVTAIAAVIISLCYVGVAVMLALVLIKGYLLVGAGVFFLLFAGWRVTAGLAEGYLVALIAVGIEIFAVHLIVGLGATVAQTWAVYLRDADGLWTLAPVWQVLAGSILFFVLAVTLPRWLAASVTGRANLGLASAVRGGR